MENDKIKEKLNEIYKLQNIKSKEWEKLRKKYQKYVDEYNNKVKDLCDFEGKFLKIEYDNSKNYSSNNFNDCFNMRNVWCIWRN